MVLTLAICTVPGSRFFRSPTWRSSWQRSPLADRGVAGSLSMLTRTIGTVTGAALLTLGFQASRAPRGPPAAPTRRLF